MRYQVPQFIDIEDKIFGPLTFKQFVYLAAGGGITLGLVTLLPLWIAIPLALPFVGIALALAFYKVNGRPFVVAIEHAAYYVVNSKLYLWKQHSQKKDPSKAPQTPAVHTSRAIPTMSESKLKDLAWSLNIKDRQQLGVTDTIPTGFEL